MADATWSYAMAVGQDTIPPVPWQKKTCGTNPADSCRRYGLHGCHPRHHTVTDSIGQYDLHVTRLFESLRIP